MGLMGLESMRWRFSSSAATSSRSKSPTVVFGFVADFASCGRNSGAGRKLA
jgi:hypothetical protein